MASLGTTYTVELLCDYPQWWRYNVYIMAVGYGGDGGEAVFNNLIDRVYEVDHLAEQRTAPEGFSDRRTLRLDTKPCGYLDLYLYIVANTFPESKIISDSPSFAAVLRVSAEGKLVAEHPLEVNQWGGLSFVVHRVGG